jgi:hypothetical protein
MRRLTEAVAEEAGVTVAEAGTAATFTAVSMATDTTAGDSTVTAGTFAAVSLALASAIMGMDMATHGGDGITGIIHTRITEMTPTMVARAMPTVVLSSTPREQCKRHWLGAAIIAAELTG